MADFVSVLPEGDELLSHQEADGYAMALVHDAEEETDGTALVRKDGNEWTLLSRVGGTFSAEDLHRLGVPPRLWNRLLIEPVGESEREEALNSGPGWPLTEEERLEDRADERAALGRVFLLGPLRLLGRNGRRRGDAEAGADAADQTPAGYQRLVNNKWENCSTFVALGWGDAEVALALGAQPVGAADWLGRCHR